MRNIFLLAFLSFFLPALALAQTGIKVNATSVYSAELLELGDFKAGETQMYGIPGRNLGNVIVFYPRIFFDLDLQDPEQRKATVNFVDTDVWYTIYVSHDPAKPDPGTGRNVVIEVYRGRGKGQLCGKKSMFAETIGVPVLSEALIGKWSYVDFRNECGLAFDISSRLNEPIGIEFTSGDILFRDLAWTEAELNKYPVLQKKILAFKAKSAATTIINVDQKKIQQPGLPPDQVGAPVQSGIQIKKYYIRFPPDVIDAVDQKFVRLPVVLIQDEATKTNNVYNYLVGKMEVRDESGRVIPRAGIFGCFGRPCFYHALVNADDVVLPNGERVGGDRGISRRTLVLENVNSGRYFVSFRFPGIQPVGLAWQISANPADPLQEGLSG